MLIVAFASLQSLLSVFGETHFVLKCSSTVANEWTKIWRCDILDQILRKLVEKLTRMNRLMSFQLTLGLESLLACCTLERTLLIQRVIIGEFQWTVLAVEASFLLMNRLDVSSKTTLD
jgi:hypothetical protein